MLYLPAIRIGFAQEVYTFIEPGFTRVFSDVTLIKENRTSEQTFLVAVTVSNPASALRAATLDGGGNSSADYRLTSPGNLITLLFPPTRQSIALSFFLISDDLPEGTEAFQASSTPVEDTPNFQPPITNTAFQNTEIRIIDDERELTI